MAWRQKWHLVGWNPAAAHTAISLICSEAQSFTLHTWLCMEFDDRPGWLPGSWVKGCLNRPLSSKSQRKGKGCHQDLREKCFGSLPTPTSTSRPDNNHFDFKLSFWICVYYYEPEPQAERKTGRTQTEPGNQRSVAWQIRALTILYF